MSRVELSFVLPAYNEEASIKDSLVAIERVVKRTKLRYEVVVVDDGSLDKTSMKAVDYASLNGHVHVVSYSKNVGKGFAVKTGFMRASGDIVVFVDSDMEIDFGQISSYVEALRHGDIVIASKSHPRSIVNVPLGRRFHSYGFNVLVRLLTGLSLRDTQTGLKALRRSAFAGVFPRLSVKGYAFDVELLVLAQLLGLRIIEMPVEIRMGGCFKIRELWGMFVDLLGIAYRLRVLHWYQSLLKQ